MFIWSDFTVWWWVCMVRDWERLDHFSWQLAQKSEDHPALPHQHVWSQQWTKSSALCEWHLPWPVRHQILNTWADGLHLRVWPCCLTSLLDTIVFLSVFPNILQVKRVVVYLGRDKTMQLLEELMYELELTDPVSSAVTHMDNPPYYRITSSYKIPSVTSGIYVLNHSDYLSFSTWPFYK